MSTMLKNNSIAKSAVALERVKKIGKYENPIHPIPMFQILMLNHNDIFEALLGLYRYVETLDARITALENKNA